VSLLAHPRSPSTSTPATVPPHEAAALIRAGRAPAGLQVSGPLRLADSTVRALPAGLRAPVLDLSNCRSLTELPPGLEVRRLNLRGCASLQALPAELRCYELDASHTPLRALPDDLRVESRLCLEDCVALERLPENLTVGSLVLRGCVSLRSLPEGLDVYFLDLAGCTQLERWPERASIHIGRLNARGCSRLRSLPPWLHELAQLDISGCRSLTELPARLRVSSWIDLADSGITWLPVAARAAQLRWRGVPIDARIAFRPETITAEEVLGEENAERRRVLLERMGYDRFLAQARAEVLDRDRDAGGERRLLRVSLPGDEPLVCVAVICPSTGRQYLLRVPPHIRTCRGAVAWVAGFDNPDDYRPIAES
jgi:hypothetical protein